jgi:hypothetical protein
LDDLLRCFSLELLGKSFDLVLGKHPEIIPL